jgi:hypothetical protein
MNPGDQDYTLREPSIGDEPQATPKILDTDTAYRAVSFIQTYTGRAFWPLKPAAEALSIIDIAHALSNQCRYSGHVKFFYSVAQHCCLLAAHVSKNHGTPEQCLQILMHDAAEAYLVDIPRPVKQFMPQYRIWDKAINDTVRQWMGWADLPILDFQDDLDSRVIVDERAALLGGSLDWGHRMRPVGVHITKWTPEMAEKQFLLQYAAYCYEAYGKHFYVNEEWGVPVAVHYETGSDNENRGADLIEVDVRGGVGRVKLRTEDGILKRDATSAQFPLRCESEWWHGKFELLERAA